MKRYIVLLLMFIAMAMQSITYANKLNNRNEVIDNKPYIKGQKEMSFNLKEVPQEMASKIKDVIFEVGGTDGGNEYFVVLPPNDVTADMGEMGIYICSGSSTNTMVVVERCGEGQVVRQPIVEKYSLLWLNANGTPSPIGTGMKLNGISESEILSNSQYPYSLDEDHISQMKSYRIYTEPDPITGICPDIYVYVASYRRATAEGYMAIATNMLGNRYMHCSSSDNDESAGNAPSLQESASNAAFRTGFTCVATQDNTTISCLLKTNIPAICITFKKRMQTGVPFNSPLLQSCDVWTVCNGLNTSLNRACDFTGSVLSSAKNFAFVSWTQRTNLPVGEAHSRDNLCEQLLPPEKWGNKYITVQFKGEYENTSKWKHLPGWKNSNPGNLFRVVAKEPNTNITVEWYDLLDHQPVNSLVFNLDYEGDFREYLSIPKTFNSDNPPQHSVAGVAVWKANKPFQLMQYHTTVDKYWYDSDNFDPGMVIVPPLAQYGTHTTFVSGCQTTNAAFMEHFATIIAEGPKLPNGMPDTNYDARKATLETIELWTNGKNPQKVGDVDNRFYVQHVPGELHYYARIKLNPNNVYRLEGKTRLSAIVYGWGKNISYMWPAAMKLVSTSGLDTLPPELYHEINCARQTTPGMLGYVTFDVHWADTVEEAPDEFRDTQKDKGLTQPPLLAFNLTENLQLVNYVYENPSMPPSQSWKSGTNFFMGYVTYRTIDPYIDVFAVVQFTDEAGNTANDTIIYVADKLEFFDNNGVAKTDINFAEVVMGDFDYFDTTIIKNINTEPVITYIENIYLQDGGKGLFKIEKIITLKDGAEVNLDDDDALITFGPQEEIMVIISFKPEDMSQVNERLLIQTQCLYWDIYLYGGAGYPRINVSDANFGNVFVGDKSPTRDIFITNKGNMELTITNYYYVLIKDGVEDTVSGVPFYYDPAYGNDPTPTNKVIIPPGGSYRLYSFYARPVIEGYDTMRLYFENDANPDFDAAYKDYAFLEVNGLTTGPAITSFNWYRKRENTINEGTVELTNHGNTDITIREFVKQNWFTRGDTLFSPGEHYFIPSVSSYYGKIVRPFDDENYTLQERTIVINVRFHPHSEYPHLENGANVGNCQEIDGFYVNFTSESNVPDYSSGAYSTLEGQAWLPKIATTGYTWVISTLVQTLSGETGEVTIHNTSYTSALLIKEINLLTGDQSEDFTIIGGPYENATILASTDEYTDELIIPVEFLPTSTNPSTRRARVEIVSDALHGEGKPGDPDPNPTRKDTVWLIAETYDIGIIVGKIDHDTITRCLNPTGQLTIQNLSTTGSLEIDTIEVEPDYAYLFEQTSHLQFPITINPNSNIQVNFRFDPCKWVDDTGKRLEGELIANVTVKSKLGSVYTTFRAVPMIIPVKLKLPNIDDTEPGNEIPIPIFIELANDSKNFYSFNNANITSFTIKLQTERKALFFENNNYNAAQSGWTFSVNQTSDGLVTITGNGSSSLTAGICAIPKATLLASALTNIPMEIVDFNVNDRECCVAWSADPGSVKSTFCAQDVRGGLIISNTIYSLPAVSPNPCLSNTLEFDYSIGLNGNTTLEIYNSNGELVKPILNGYAKIGKYTANVDVSDLASGAYTIVLKSEQFEETQKLIIIK